MYSTGKAQTVRHFLIPFLESNPAIDGDLSDWQFSAFSDGRWDIARVKSSDWYSPKRNKLTVHVGEDSNKIDLASNYFVAWSNTHLILGAIVVDNHIDVIDPKHQDKRWYYKDAIAWFFEFPHDSIPEKFGEGNHAFAFVADTTYPNYGAWWRHGSSTENYIEEPLSADQVEYVIKTTESGYVLEAKISVNETILEHLTISDWKTGLLGSMMIVHCDPDGGDYGGHLLIYGKGDNDSTWTKIKLVDHVE